jgi:hypothetical protein
MNTSQRCDHFAPPAREIWLRNGNAATGGV